MKPIETPLGNLNVLEAACPKQIAAELRGLDLLISLVNESPRWHISQTSSIPFLMSDDGAPGIQVNIFASMKARIHGGDPHLDIMMGQRKVCVLRNRSDVMTPSTDAMVSLVLLGNMGWPIQHTPSTLSKKAMAQLEEPFECLERDLRLKELDYQAIEFAVDCYQAGQHMNAIGILGEMARSWYVCRAWELEDIQPIIAELLNEFDRKHVEAYLEDPQCPEDVMFLAV